MLLFAQLLGLDLSTTLLLGLKLALAVGAAVVGWLVTPPLAALLYRLVVHQPIPKWAQGLSSLVGAMVVGLLAFWLIPIGGFGGQGLGLGGIGLGTGNDAGKGNNGNQDETKKATAKVTNNEPKKTAAKFPERGVLSIEMNVLTNSREYKEDKKWYLIDGKLPAKTIGEIEDFLHDHKGKWKLVEIIVWADSDNQWSVPVRQLQKLAKAAGLNWYFAEEYATKFKTAEVGTQSN